MLGADRIPSRADYKYAMLRAQFSLLLIGVAIFYLFLDYYNGMIEFLPWYAFMVGVGLACIILNRVGFYKSANLLLMVTLNGLVFIFADVDHPIGGVFFYFMSIAVVGLILFNKQGNRVLQLIFGVLPILLGLTAILWDFNLIGFPSRNPEIMQITFLSNFTIGILSTVLIVLFLINRSDESEESLIASEAAMKKASDDLKSSEQRYSMALQGTRAGIYEWYVMEDRVEVSPHWKSLLGYSPTEMLDIRIDTFMTMVHPEDAERVSAAVLNHVKNQLPYQNEVRLCTKDGTYRWFQDSGVGKADESGNLKVVIGSIIDIHERKEAEEKVLHQNDLLAKANKELDYFVYSVSHDLRAPLSSILGLTSIYSMSKTQHEKDEIVKMIGDRANVLDEFIREVLDYSRNSRLEVKPQPIMIWEVVDEVLAGLAHMDGYGALTIRTTIPSDLTVISDCERLKVILANLFSNAIKYRDGSKESFLATKAYRTDKEWFLEIQDNGIGIKEEHLPHIFDMFYKAHDTSRGTGLGLYIVQEAVQRLKGKIVVTSKYGGGTTFTIRTPL